MDYTDIKKELEELKQQLRESIEKVDKITSSLPNINPEPTPTSPHYYKKYDLGELGSVTLRQYPQMIDPSKPVVFIDEGHGGLDEEGNYTTPAKYGKRFKHDPKIVNGGMDQNGEGWIYEGVLNRCLVEDLCGQLRQAQIQYIIISDEVEDVSLSDRVSIIDELYKMYPHGFLFSVHCNAFRGESRGSCLFTTRGETKSDLIAQHIAPHLYDLEDEFGDDGFWVRDGSGKINQIDYEKNFTILMCKPPAVMSEVLFFDNVKDVQLLLSPIFSIRFMSKVVRGIKSYITNPSTPRKLPKK